MFLEQFFFPRHCLSCGKIGSYFCSDCNSKLKRVKKQVCIYCFKPSLAGLTHISCKRRYGVDGFIGLFYYHGVAGRVIKKLKYKLVKAGFDDFLNSIKADILQNLSPIMKINNSITICPVPLHKTRERWRGFNQALYIAEYISSLFNKPLDNILLRKKDTVPQSFLKDHSKRKSNVKGAFEIRSGVDIKGKNFILVDDIVTSGHTTKEAARVLKTGGAENVFVFSIARG